MSDKSTEAFKKVIQEYIEKVAYEDPLFGESYRNPEKNIESCCAYIIATVKKSGKEGFADDEIFNMALHYYDEADIKNEKLESCNVVVNHVVELTEEEIAEAREKAKEALVKEQIASNKKQAVKPAVKAPQAQMDLFG